MITTDLASRPRVHPFKSGLVALMFLGWAGWVAWNYRTVDGGVLPFPTRPMLAVFGVGALIALLAGGLAGLLCRNSLHPGRRVAAGGAVLILLLLAWGKFGPAFLAQPDFVRISAFLLYGAAGGAGFTWMLRRSAFQRDILAVVLVLPFAAFSFIADRGVSALALLVTMLASAGLGRTLQEKLAPGFAPEPTAAGLAVSVRLALGMLSLGLIAFLLGLLHLAYPPVLLAAVGVVLLATRTAVLREIEPLWRWLSTPAPCTRAGGWIAGITWALLLIAWIAALAPEMGPDALGGRLAIVKLWADDHALATYREMILSYMAVGAETFFLILFPLAGQQAAKLGQLVAVLAMLPAAASLVGHRTAAARLLWLALGASSLVLVQFAWGFVDLVQSLYYVTALGAGWLWWQQRRRGLLLIAALLAASATAVKLNGLGAVLILGAVVVVARLREPRPWRELAWDTLIVSVGAGLILGPWLLRSFITSGNPVFPYANGFFASPLAPLELTAKRFGDPLSIASVVRLPWRLFFEPGHYAELGAYHPLLLAAMPLLLAAVLSARSRYWILTGLAAAGLWCITEQNARYSLFAAWLLVGGTAVWLDQWLAQRPPSARLLAAVAGAMFFFGGSYALLARPSAWLFRGFDGSALPLRVVLGQVSRHDYLKMYLPHVALLKQVDEASGSRAVVWEVPWLRDHLHLAGRAIALPHCDHRLGLKLRALLDLQATPENLRQIHQTLLDLGITHLILPPDSTWSPTAPDRPLSAIYSEVFLETAARLEGANGGYLLLSLRPQFNEPRPLQLGPNLFANPDFQLPQPDQPPTNWYQGTALGKPYETPLTLPAGFNIGQQVSVQPGQLYRFDITMPAGLPPPQGALMHTAWRDANGNLLFYFTFRVDAKTTAGLSRNYQTAPANARLVNIDIRGPLSLTRISLQAVMPGQ